MERTRVSKQRISYLIIIMAAVSSIVALSAIWILYSVSFEQQELRLLEVAQSRARIIEAMSSFDAKYHKYDHIGGSFDATLSQIKAAHNNFEGFGETGEFTLAEMKGDQIVFLLQHRHDNINVASRKAEPFKMGSQLAEPMQRVLDGQSGAMIGLDYRGETVLAAYEPVSWPGRKVGIVAKIDLSEIREPFVKAGLITSLIAAITILLGAIVFRKVSNPLIKNLEESEARFRSIFESDMMGILFWDANGEITDANDAFLKIVGYSREDVLSGGLKWSELTPPEYAERDTELLKELAEKGVMTPIEKEYIHKSGGRIPVMLGAATFLGATASGVAFVLDITERREAEAALRQSNETWQGIMEAAFDSIVVYTVDGVILAANEIFAKRFGISIDKLIGENIFDLMPSDLIEERRKRVNDVVRSKQILQLEESVGRKIFDYTIYPVIEEAGDVTKIVVFSSDITERKGTEKALIQSEKLYHSLVEAMNEGVAMVDENGLITYINEQCCKILGHPKSEIIGEHWMSFYDENAQKVIAEQLKKRAKGSSEPYEVENRRKDGTKVWISISPKPIYDEGGNVKGSMAMFQDITERKKAEEQIKASLNEKELLLREVHHRVKNNMQVISSLLRLQADRADDKGYAVMLKESQLRIQSMSLIHEKLYLSNDFANIDFKGYVKTLANTLIKSHGVDYDKISLSIEIEDVSLDIENAIPCGLIINELLSNSLKYAFPEEREGEISISLRSISEEKLELVVADNGIGLPEDLDIRNTNTLGLYLVTMLAERQLDGEVEMKREAGMECSISFKKQDYKPRI